MKLQLLQVTPPWDWPPDAGANLQEALTDRQAKVPDRLIAAELGGNLAVVNDGLADALLAVVRSAAESVPMRAKAAISLGPVLEQADTFGFEDPDDVPITLRTFRKIQETLHQFYLDESTPKEVRRRILEASVRASQDWHEDAVRTAYSSGDREWMLTAVFAMGWVRGFDNEVLEALHHPDADIQAEAITAAGKWQLGEAWSRIAPLVTHPGTPKPLLLAAIEAVAQIRPKQAVGLLVDLAASEDEDISDAATEALEMADEDSDFEEDFEEGDDDIRDPDDSDWLN